jgi:hypothetical protein
MFHLNQVSELGGESVFSVKIVNTSAVQYSLFVHFSWFQIFGSKN